MPKIYCYTNEQKTEKKYFVKCDTNIVTSKDEDKSFSSDIKSCEIIVNLLSIINDYNKWQIQL